MAFMLPMGELIYTGISSGIVGNMVNTVYNEFKEPAKKLLTQETGKLIGSYAKNHPGGLIDSILDASSMSKGKKPVRKLNR